MFWKQVWAQFLALAIENQPKIISFDKILQKTLVTSERTQEIFFCFFV